MFLFKLLLVGLGNWVVSHHDTSELLFTHLSLLQRFINIYCDWLIVDLWARVKRFEICSIIRLE